MAVDLYYIPLSPPCRTVMMAAYMAGVDVNLKLVNLMAGEQMKPEFLKVNPLHTVPAIDDKGFYLSESQAISIYLVNQYAKNDRLYPEDAQQRARVDQMLNFDASSLFPRFRDLYVVSARQGAKELDPEKKKAFHEALGFFDVMMKDRKYAAVDHLTVADLALIATVSSIHAVDEHILDGYPVIKDWFNRCQSEIDHYEELNGSGAKLLGQWIQGAMKKNKSAA